MMHILFMSHPLKIYMAVIKAVAVFMIPIQPPFNTRKSAKDQAVNIFSMAQAIFKEADTQIAEPFPNCVLAENLPYGFPSHDFAGPAVVYYMNTVEASYPAHITYFVSPFMPSDRAPSFAGKFLSSENDIGSHSLPPRKAVAVRARPGCNPWSGSLFIRNIVKASRES